MQAFDKNDLKKLYQPPKNSRGEDNGQVVIIGGSKLFHGAPIFSLKVASRMVDMVFFASPEPSVGRVAEQIKSKLMSFIWVPWEEIEGYLEKSDAVLIGPGFMSFRSEADRSIVRETKEITKKLLREFSNKRWVIDAGSLQVMEPSWIPENAILTPNKKEFEMLFGKKEVGEAARETKSVIVLKTPKTTICSPEKCVQVANGNPGMTKGGIGDCQAGLTVALLAKNEPFLAASAAAYLTKAVADNLYAQVGTHYNASDLADKIPQFLHNLQEL